VDLCPFAIVLSALEDWETKSLCLIFRSRRSVTNVAFG
jgi:hypothetical protein